MRADVGGWDGWDGWDGCGRMRADGTDAGGCERMWADGTRLHAAAQEHVGRQRLAVGLGRYVLIAAIQGGCGGGVGGGRGRDADGLSQGGAGAAVGAPTAAAAAACVGRGLQPGGWFVLERGFCKNYGGWSAGGLAETSVLISTRSDSRHTGK